MRFFFYNTRTTVKDQICEKKLKGIHRTKRSGNGWLTAPDIHHSHEWVNITEKQTGTVNAMVLDSLLPTCYSSTKCPSKPFCHDKLHLENFLWAATAIKLSILTELVLIKPLSKYVHAYLLLTEQAKKSHSGMLITQTKRFSTKAFQIQKPAFKSSIGKPDAKLYKL